MIAILVFENPRGWLLAAPLGLLVLFGAWRQHRRGLKTGAILASGALRAMALGLLIGLLARPVQLIREPIVAAARPVVVLMDRSESMSLEEQEASRYEKAVEFLRERLLPALKSAHLPVRAVLFDEQSEAADGPKIAAASPHGKRTNLGGAIAQSLGGAPEPPLAIIALTDGIANESADNARALGALVEAHAPFIGVGFGTDEGVRTLTLHSLEAPSTVPTKASFSIAAELEAVNGEEVPGCDLLLFRDGTLLRKTTLSIGTGSRSWLENFEVHEDQEGVHTYTAQLIPPNQPGLKCVNSSASTSVRISDEKELRVLYVQGALTWDYKFIGLALRNDPSIRLTGLTRTSKQSVFRQNVENAGELLDGFPTRLEELAPFRVIVLSNLRAADLTVAQQELLARFCGELGGGVLMIGGAATFDSSWQNSRLEQLLPVEFSANPGVLGLDRPFQPRLTDEALRHPVFQISDERAAREIWERLPSFSQYGRVDGVKPGAQVWMTHPVDVGPRGKRVLMAAQRYGAGASAVLAIQNFWRWRLAKESNPQEFDRFWQQLFRFLSDSGRQDVAIHLAEQDLHPQMDVRVLLEKQPNPKNLGDTRSRFVVRAEDANKALLNEESVELEPLKPVEFMFHAEKAGVYAITVSDSLKVPVAARSIEIRDVNVEFQNTGRNMESLRQWASVSDGLAFKVEECLDASDLVSRIQARIEQARQGRQIRRPVGVGGWTLGLMLGCLGLEWGLRKRWSLR